MLTCPSTIVLNKGPYAYQTNVAQYTINDISASGGRQTCNAGEQVFSANSMGPSFNNGNVFLQIEPSVCAKNSQEALAKIQSLGSVEFKLQPNSNNSSSNNYNACYMVNPVQPVESSQPANAYTSCTYTSDQIPGARLMYSNGSVFFPWSNS